MTYEDGIREALEIVEQYRAKKGFDGFSLRIVASEIASKLNVQKVRRDKADREAQFLATLDDIAGRIVAGAEQDIAEEDARFTREQNGRGGQVFAVVRFSPVLTRRWLEFAVERKIPGAKATLDKVLYREAYATTARDQKRRDEGLSESQKGEYSRE